VSRCFREKIVIVSNFIALTLTRLSYVLLFNSREAIVNIRACVRVCFIIIVVVVAVVVVFLLL